MIQQMDFSQALLNLKNGVRCTRAGWFGKGMHVYLEGDFKYLVGGGVYAGTTRRYGPCLVLYVGSTDTHYPGWLASQADILAEDWETVP